MAKSKPLPPLEELQKVLSYNPETGVFTWIVSPSPRAPAGSVAGYINPSRGYRRIKFQDGIWATHRLAWLFGTGEDPGDLTVDHINRNKLDNRLVNLRLATQAQQNMNKGLRSNNTSGFKGVCWHRENRKWRAKVYIKGKGKHLGYFATKEEAVEAYQKAAADNYGEFLAS